MTNRLWLITLHEYRRHVLSKGFVLVILSVPLLIAFSLGMGLLAQRMGYDGRPIGYVDHSGRLTAPVQAAPRSNSILGRLSRQPVLILNYASENLARADLQAGTIQAFYVFPAEYPKARAVQLECQRYPGSDVARQFENFVRTNLLTNYPTQVATRVLEGTFLTVRTLDGTREYSQRAEIAQVLPLFVSLAFLMLFLTTSGTLMQAVVEEKDSRTSEIMFTSVSTRQFMGGKVLGVVAMAGTEVLAWGAIIALVMFIAARIPGLEWVRYVRMHPRTVLTIVAFAIPAFILYCALTAALGALVADAQESQQVSALFALPSTAPFYLAFSLIERPSSLAAILLTLFPLTALTSLCIRITFATVPLWQLLASWALLVLSALGSVALAGRAFRLGMLRYGQRVAWRELFGPRQKGASPAQPSAGGG